jgi:hypothetical protein
MEGLTTYEPVAGKELLVVLRLSSPAVTDAGGARLVPSWSHDCRVGPDCARIIPSTMSPRVVCVARTEVRPED